MKIVEQAHGLHWGSRPSVCFAQVLLAHAAFAYSTENELEKGFTMRGSPGHLFYVNATFSGHTGQTLEWSLLIINDLYNDLECWLLGESSPFCWFHGSRWFMLVQWPVASWTALALFQRGEATPFRVSSNPVQLLKLHAVPWCQKRTKQDATRKTQGKTAHANLERKASRNRCFVGCEDSLHKWLFGETISFFWLFRVSGYFRTRCTFANSFEMSEMDRCWQDVE